MKILFAIPLSILFYLSFGSTLLLFHLIQFLSYNLGGYSAHHKSVKAMNWTLMLCTKILGTSYRFSGKESIPKNVPLIFVSNHQSMFDISPIEWYLSEFHPKFISKKELGKGIPSVSYNLQKGGSVLIDRKDGKSSILQIKKLATYIKQNNYSAVIFPEGTRSRDGVPKAFKESGLKVLCKYADNAYIVPITINNSWKMQQKKFPMNLGVKIQLQCHEPIAVAKKDFDQLLYQVENIITSSVENPKK
ncbi:MULTISPECIES: lysophospholipid acyltransferase family protein [Weeksella]|uniref:Phospholipid/glycerol acyltransferase n=1 Tax=Weeksella virosa (strain ATCC 43766 / DSM 16922 / JCM 21250 / CCUG 30538 / CDC 9751 / IAM 14551 / NBRC 16016 / NCTC 11634 / CL345/78) TaxID=865938 RepID=F0NXN5_WEEVC|nr:MULTISPECIES: lysophospholipid acyltransferase family protein [Weeksella]ADX66942.1 phospholipid/glycerol acyltransferase [Weeksella virosa DSM 16922]MDK7674929.1 lysophospholipid acyltransferase family protein [Weeksella virosa]OFM84190.1 glycerol acyltransferase [Weeksella sp. HMSC059D05]SUP53257.1 2-acyl-glycerophospho-ethanolamine acyltransferase [Weeksella virosa]VEH63329.1 2-acyl-glycerophospho-ethanolamine acyltransferase [Weeksella virosa]